MTIKAMMTQIKDDAAEQDSVESAAAADGRLDDGDEASGADASTGAEDDGHAEAVLDADRSEVASGGHTKPARQAIGFGLAVVVALASLACWFEYRAHESHQRADRRAAYIAAANQEAVNLTTVDWQQPDKDVQRILDGATGQFYDEFSQRDQPFVDVVKQTHAKTVGTVAAAGLESESPDGADILVAVNVKTETAAAPQQSPRNWRMRLVVQRAAGQLKIAKVEFVP